MRSKLIVGNWKMNGMQGKANPEMVNELMKEELEKA